MAAFLVILLIVSHRFLRLDITNEWVAALHPPTLLTTLLVLTFTIGVVWKTVRVRAERLVLIQWGLWGWSLACKMIADGVTTIVDFIKNDYTKDVIFASLLSMLVDSLRKLRVLAAAFVAVMTFISIIALPQRDGIKKCFHFRNRGSDIVYEQVTDNRRCVAMADCFDLPPGEESLRDEGWSCEREGTWGIGSVLGRIRYVGSLADPNALSLALVMACSLGLGLATWPIKEGRSRRQRVLQALALASVVVMAMAIIYAASRAAQAATALALLTFFYSRIGPLGMAVAGVAAAPLVLISRRNEAEALYSTWTRVQTHLNGYQAFLDEPMFGVGWGNYEKISFITAHDSFLLAATETGAVGCALFCLGIYMAFKLLILVIRWPEEYEAYEDPVPLPYNPGALGFIQDWLEQPATVRELRHFAITLLAMLVGVGTCVSFLSLTFDVMWLFPVGVLAAFHNVVRDRLPEFELRLRWFEAVAVLAMGFMMPGLLVVIATRKW